MRKYTNIHPNKTSVSVIIDDGFGGRITKTLRHGASIFLGDVQSDAIANLIKQGKIEEQDFTDKEIEKFNITDNQTDDSVNFKPVLDALKSLETGSTFELDYEKLEKIIKDGVSSNKTFYIAKPSISAIASKVAEGLAPKFDELNQTLSDVAEQLGKVVESFE